MEKKPSRLTFFRQISLIHSLTITSACVFSQIETLGGLYSEFHLLHPCSLHTHRYIVPAAISPCSWMPLIPVPHLLRWETGDRGNLGERNVPPLHRRPSLFSFHPFSSIHIQQVEACGMRRDGRGRWRWGERGKLVWVIVNSAPARLVAREWPIISHWAKWHEFININNSSKFIFSGWRTEAQAGPH